MLKALLILFAVLWGLGLVLTLAMAHAMNRKGPSKRQCRRLYALVFRLLAEHGGREGIDLGMDDAGKALDAGERFERVPGGTPGAPAWRILHNGLAFLVTLQAGGFETLVLVENVPGPAGARDGSTGGRLDEAFAAIRTGDLNTVRRIFESGVGVNARHSLGGTCVLAAAALCGRTEIMEWLLGHGAEADARDAMGWTPLLCVLWCSMRRGVQSEPGRRPAPSDIDLSKVPSDDRLAGSALLLIRRGADVHARGDRGMQAIHLVAWMKDCAVAQALLENGADINAPDDGGCTLLSYAAAAGNEAMVRFAVANGAAIEHEDAHGQTPLIAAAGEGRTAAAVLLLEHGANASFRTDSGLAALHMAAEHGDAVLAAALLDHGAWMEAAGPSAVTPLWCAARSGREDVLRLLLARGACIDAPDSCGGTPLIAAAARGRLVCVEALLEHGAGVDKADSRGSTALWWAADGGWFEVVRSLCAAGADRNIRGSRGTPLMAALRRGHHDIVEFLMQDGGADGPAEGWDAGL